MNLDHFKLLAAISLFLTAALVVIYPIKFRTTPKHNHFLELADAFASGIFLGAALFHMLPDAIRDFNLIYPSVSYPIAEAFSSIGFLTLLFLERISKYLTLEKNYTKLLPYMLASILIVHALIEGTVLGVNGTLATAAVIFLAIIAHKSSESFALAIVLNQSQLNLRHVIFLIILFSLMTPLGIAIGTLMTQSMTTSSLLFTASFNAFAGGTFLYMSTLHHINHHQRLHEAENLWEFGALVVGLVLMAVLAKWA